MRLKNKIEDLFQIAVRASSLTLVLAASLSVAPGSSAQSASKIPSTLKRPHAALALEYGKLPMSFERNEGQAQSDIKFLARGQGYAVALTNDGAILSLYDTGDHQSQAGRKATPRIQLVGANPNPEISGVDELPGKVNYVLGNDPKKWRTNLPTYSRILYKGVYPGIDMVYRGDQGKLEFDFIVHPGADPNLIQIEDLGLNSLKLNGAGDLVAEVSGCTIFLKKPFTYQERGAKRREVASNFVRGKEGQIAFHVGAYDKSSELVIDPTLQYSTFLGAANPALYPFSLAVDGKGEAIVAGLVQGTFVVTSGAFDTGAPTPSYLYTPFVMKLNAAGTALVYATYLGGTDPTGIIKTPYNPLDAITSVATDPSGNAYLTGRTNALNFPVTAGAYQATSPCTSAYQLNGLCMRSSAFVTELNSSGSGLVYSTYFGGTSGVGDVLYYLSAAGTWDISGYEYVRQAPIGEAGLGIAVDSTGIYITGVAIAPDLPVTAGAGQPAIGQYAPPNNSDAGFVAKFATGGSLAYSTYIGGDAGITAPRAIAVDTSGNAYVTGYTRTNFPTTPGAYQGTLSSTPTTANYSAFVTKVNGNGGFAYSTLFAASTNVAPGLFSIPAYPVAIAVDSLGSAYITGASLTAGFGGATPANMALPTTPGAYLTQCVSDTLPPAAPYCSPDAFVTKFSPDGSSLVYSTYLGGPGADSGVSIALLGGNAVVLGVTESLHATDMYPTTPDTSITSCALFSTCAFLTELSADGSSLVDSVMFGGIPGFNQPVALALDSSGNAYVAGVTNSAAFPTTAGAYDTSLTQSVAGSSPGGFLTSFGLGGKSSQITVLPTTIPAGAVNLFYGPITFTQTGGTGTITWSTPSTLPTGITFAGGVLQGVPTQSGTFPLTITAKDSAGNQGSVTVSLSIYAATTATISAQSCSSTPITSFDFGPVPVGTTNGQYICLNNTGTANLYISISTLLPATTYFNAASTTCNILESTPPNATNGIAPGSSCQVLMNFSPSAVGPVPPVYLSFSDNAGNQTVSLTGTGLARTTAIFSAGVCSVSATPITNLDFGSVIVGSSAQQTLCITNTGTQNPLYLTAIYPPILLPFSKVSDNCPRGVPPASTGIPKQQSCQMVIAFTPTLPVTYSGTGFEVYDNAGNHPLTLSGTGASPSADVSVAPNGSASGTVGTSMALSFTVKNNGPSATTSTTLSDALPSSFTFVSASAGCSNAAGVVTCALGPLAVSQSVTVTITVNPTASGSIADTATISSAPTDPNPANNSATITAQVTATSPGGGPACLCSNGANYVSPANGVAPAPGATSPHGKYALSTSGTGPVNLIITKGSTTVLNQSVAGNALWGFSPDDDRFVTDEVVSGTETITLYNLANPLSAPIASKSLLIGVASSGGNPSQILFSPSGNFLLYVALTANSTSSQIDIYNAKTGKLVFNSTAIPLVTVAGSGEDQFGLVSFGFSPGSPETSFLYAFVSSSTSVQWNLVSLSGTNKTTANGSVLTTYATSAYWQYSPCADILALVQQPSQSSLEVTLYQVSTGKQLSDNSNLPLGNLTLSSSATSQVAQVLTVSGTQTVNLLTNCAPPASPPPISAQLTATTGQLTIDGSGNYIVPVNVQNTGTVTASNVAISSAALAATVGGKPQSTATLSALPASLGTIAVGKSVTYTLTFPAAAGGQNTAALLRLVFTFTGGSASSTLHLTLP